MGGTTKEKLAIWGTSGHASVVADVIRLGNDYEIFGFIDDVNPEKTGSRFGGAYVLGGQEKLEDLFQQGVEHIIFGFGNCEARLRLTELVRGKGFRLAIAIHPSAVLATDVAVGAGTVIAAGAVINPGTTIGENVIVNTCASVDHDCRVEDGAHVCPGVRLAGNVIVGRATWVGIGATVVGKTRIGSGTIIGAGAVVVDDIPDGVVARGAPARVIRKVRPDA
jgi:UDP-N-acetylbacillosamine N-acetyltransferase